MPLAARPGAARPRTGVLDRVQAVLAWHARRPQASLRDATGWMWMALVAATFFWMSNPTVFIPSFYLSLGQALIFTRLAVALALPWLRAPLVPWPWLAFLGLGLASQWWTIDAFHTDVTNVVYCQVTALAVIVAANCEPLVVAWGVSLGGVAVVVLSVHAFHEEVVGSSYAALEGVIFTGVGSNQNILAYTLAISTGTTLALGWQRTWGLRVAWLGVLATNLYGLRLANSATGYLTAMALGFAALAVVGWPSLRRLARRTAAAWVVGAVVALGVASVLVVFVLGRQLSTFSGRAPFWGAAIETTMDVAPVLGSGWGAVWSHPWNPAAANPVADQIYARAGYSLTHGHNAFVDVLPELGLVGLALLVLMVAYAVRAVARAGVHDRGQGGLAGRLVLMCLVALLVFGVTEPMLTVPVGWWSLTVLVTSARLRQRPRSRGRRARTV